MTTYDDCPAYACMPFWNDYLALSGLYLTFFLFGVCSLLLFSSQMIAQSTYLSNEKRDPIGLFAPKYLTFPTKYRLASISYCVLLLLGYSLFVLILDKPGVDLPSWGGYKHAAGEPAAAKIKRRGAEFPLKQLDEAVPLLLAFMLIGILPRIRPVEVYEKRLRESIHEVFLIPALGRATAERIATSRIREDAIPHHCVTPAEAEQIEARLDFKFDGDLQRLEFLVSVPEKIRAHDLGKYFDANHVASYKDRFEAAESLTVKLCKDIKEAVEIIKAAPKRDKLVDLVADRLQTGHQAIEDEVRFLSLVIAGAILRKSNNEEQINRALFKIGLEEPISALERRPGDTAIVVSAGVAVLYWFWEVVRQLIGLVGHRPDMLGGIAGMLVDVSLDAVVTFVIYAFVCFVGLFYQARKKRKNLWAADGDAGYARVTLYFRLIIFTFLIGFLVIFGFQAAAFAWLFRATGAPNWSNMAILGVAQGIPIAALTLIAALLADRPKGRGDKNGYIWLALWLGVIAIVGFLSGFFAEYGNQYVASSAGGRTTAITNEHLREVFANGILGLLTFLAVAFAVSSDLRQVVSGLPSRMRAAAVALTARH